MRSALAFQLLTFAIVQGELDGFSAHAEKPSGRLRQLFRLTRRVEEAAVVARQYCVRTAFGSSLQAYCRNRDRQRIISNWGHEKFLALPFNDGGVIGSKIALFAGPATEALANNGVILSYQDYVNAFSGAEPQYTPYSNITPGLGELQVFYNGAYSSYNALQVEARKISTAHGLQFQANYTWGKVMTDADDLWKFAIRL